MNSIPVAHILTADAREHASWAGWAEVSSLMPSGWSLAGGNLVRLHLEERGSDAARSTRDIDIILDIRAEPWAIRTVVNALRQSRFEPDGINPAGYDHRWVRGDAQIDVLTPDFLGPNLLDRRHPGLGRLLPTRGAQLALNRTRRVTVRVDDFELEVNRPDLVGGLYGKCSALLVSLDLSKDRHLSDIAALAAVVGPNDRRELLKLRRRERRRIIHGLTRAMGSDDVSDSQRQVLDRLSALLTSSLDAVQNGPGVDGDTSPRRR